MNQRLWRQVEEIFHKALEHTPETRPAFLDIACGQDTELREQVDSLLSRENEAGSFLETPAMGDVTISVAAAPPIVGRHFGPYRIISLLGAGGMGEVYRAHDSKLGREVAIKILPIEFARDPDRLARFRREARTLASLNHPHIASIYGFESGDVDYLVMELVEGDTLHGPLPLVIALEYARQVADALEAAHGKAIIHRDLKPANVKVTPQGKVKVLDFGLAKAISAEEKQDLSLPATVTGAESLLGNIVGTPGYMSPEQACGRDVDQRTDIWAFGCLLYELLTGKRAFAGGTLKETLVSILHNEPDWQALPSSTPANIRDLLRECVQKDSSRRLQNIADVRRIIEKAQRGWNRWRIAAISAGALGILALAASLLLRNPSAMSDRAKWVQLTKLPGSVVQPALSPDGRMLAFIRGNSTFFGAGQIYVKMLPDGVPKALTNDNVSKMGPAFSPDGSRIAYTTVESFNWDTWVVPTFGGEPQVWLRNASGLIWTGLRRVLFSEMRKAPHMAIVTSQESRVDQRDAYLPAHEHGMAHRSYLSPDGKWVLLVEMDHDHHWTPCRLVPSDGSSHGRKVGPLGASCTFAAWTPDGKWMYFTSVAGGANHTWRQRFPEGLPEQVTSGPTEEEGIAMAPDGRSFVTAVTLSNVAVWIHDANGERPIAVEGNTADPRFTPDGTKLFYRVVKQTPTEFWFMDGGAGEVWLTELKSGHSAPLVPGFESFDYDISADGRQVVLETAERDGTPKLWVVDLDRQSVPRQIPNVTGRTPRFGPTGEVFFRTSGFTFRVRPDGTGLRKAVEYPTNLLTGISPDGRWLVAWSPTQPKGMAIQAFPLEGGPPVVIARGLRGLRFSTDGRSLSAWGGPIGPNRSYVMKVAPGQTLPKLPVLGFRSEQEFAALPGARKMDAQGVVPGPSPDVYAFYRGNIQRDLYRIPIQ